MFKLPELQFDTGKFKNWTTKETFSFHYGKHHAGYVKKLNLAIQDTEWENKSLIEIIQKNKNNPSIFNNAAQHFNHSFFWNCITPNESIIPEPLLKKIEQDFDSFDNFKKIFSETSSTLFGSGWTWLVKDEQNKLQVMKTYNANTPITENLTPLLTIDVWEHAYYLDYQNSRGDFIASFWNYIDWNFVNNQFSN